MPYLTQSERLLEKQKEKEALKSYLNSLLNNPTYPISAFFRLKFPINYTYTAHTTDLYSYLERVFKELMRPQGYKLDYKWTEEVRKLYGRPLVLEDIMGIEIEIVWSRAV